MSSFKYSRHVDKKLSAHSCSGEQRSSSVLPRTLALRILQNACVTTGISYDNESACTSSGFFKQIFYSNQNCPKKVFAKLNYEYLSFNILFKNLETIFGSALFIYMNEFLKFALKQIEFS